MHEKRIEIRWRDLDAYGHVNNAVYSTYLEECRDEWLEAAIGKAEDEGWDFVIARLQIDFRRELRLEDDAVVVRCALAKVGRSSVTTREEIRVPLPHLWAPTAAIRALRTSLATVTSSNASLTPSASS